MVYFDDAKYMTRFLQLVNIEPEKERKKEIHRKQQFFDVLNAESVTDVDISIDELMVLMENSSGYCGQKYSFQEKMENDIKKISKLESVGRKRVL